MTRQTFARRSGWLATGAAAALLLAACASVTEAPEPVAGSAALPPLPAAGVPAVPAPPPAAPLSSGYAGNPAGAGGANGQAGQSGQQGQQGPGEPNTIVVTGTRVRRDDFSSPNATITVTAEDMRNLGVVSIADMINQLPDNVTPVAPGTSTDSNFNSGASVANLRGLGMTGTRGLNFVDSRRIDGDGGNERSPLSRVAPGEELWIISQPGSDEPLQAAVAEDALGPGVMLARFTPVVLSGEAPTPREIPLPLKHTDVDARISGYVGTVDVTQQFENPYDQKIEAVYLFPLPEKAAVSEFVMTIGERRIRGILREKAEAQQIYREARAQGYQASLLTQHRPNVFEQRVANIEPGKQIDINIRYYETLAYADGWYSFVFPTVVGPRYNPPGSKDPLLALPQSNVVPTPAAAVRYLTPGTSSAHDISIAVELDAGVAIEEIDSSHPIDTETLRDGIVRVGLSDGATLPNRDFRLNFRVAGETIKSNLLSYIDEETGDGYFTLMLYPPAGLEQLKRQPLELVFVLDCSGSMNGAPMAQAKAAILAALDRLEPNDTFQIIRFSQNASQFGPAPVLATPDNLRAARDYVFGLQGMGGTQMIEGIRAALGFPHDEERLRFVTFLTDGYIGNETDILAAIDRGLGASRIFSFGVGSAPNRYLLERMASTGRGAVAYLSLEDSGRVVMDAFFDRVAHPAMIDVEIDYGSMAVRDVYPRRLPDLFVGRPLVVTGRFEGRPGAVELRGRAGGERVAVSFARERSAPEHAYLPNLWARLKIADLNDELSVNPASGQRLAAEIRQTALDYELMSDYTAFIAVDASQVTAGTSGTTVYQAVPVPDGVRYETAVGR